MGVNKKFRGSNSFIMLMIALVFIQCHKDDEISRLKKALTIEELKVSLYNAKDTFNLITTVKQSSTNFTILFESGDSLIANQDLIVSTQQIPEEWALKFTFADNTSMSVPMIGDLLISVKLNPFGNCPLCAVAKITTPVKGRFSVIVHGKTEDGISIQKEFMQYSYSHEIPILGLYASYPNDVELIFLNKDGKRRVSKRVVIETEGIATPSSMTIISNKFTSPSQDLYFSANKGLGFDQKGEIRWYFKPTDNNFLYIFPKLKNGNLLIVGSDGAYVYHSSNFYEITPLGQVVRKYFVPNFLHHEIVEMPNGNFLVASNSQPIEFTDGISEEEVIIEIDRISGSIIKQWDFRDILDIDRTPIPSTRPDDWLHINAIQYDENDHSIIVSGRSQSTVVKIDYETSKIKWILSNHNLWKSEFQSYLLAPVDASGNAVNTAEVDFWPSGQHSPRFNEKRNLILYDNGDYRRFYDDPMSSSDSYSRFVEYKINETDRTIQIIRQFDYAKSLFTKYTGSVNYLKSTNTTLIGYMYLTFPKILEIDQNNEILFEANFSNDLANYRALRVDMYDNVSY